MSEHEKKYTFSNVENNLIEAIKGHFGKHIKGVQSMSGSIDAGTFLRQSLGAPGIATRFIGVTTETPNNTVSVRFGIFIVAKNAAGRKDNKIDAYSMVEHLYVLLTDYKVPKMGTVKINSANELFSKSTDANGLIIWAMDIELKVSLSMGLDLASLDQFATFTAEYPDKDTASSKTTLEQGETE